MAERDLEERARLARQAPSEERMAALLNAVAPFVSGRVHRHIRDEDDAADVSQEVLVKIFTRLQSWDPKRGSFRVWVSVITRSVALDHLRHRSRIVATRRDEEQSEDVLRNAVETDTPRYLARIEDAAMIRSLYARLRALRDVHGRRVLAAARDLAYLGEDLSTSAIARQAELSESTTRRALVRVRLLAEKLRES